MFMLAQARIIELLDRLSIFTFYVLLCFVIYIYYQVFSISLTSVLKLV
jgi:hypothetical protein